MWSIQRAIRLHFVTEPTKGETLRVVIPRSGRINSQVVPAPDTTVNMCWTMTPPFCALVQSPWQRHPYMEVNVARGATLVNRISKSSGRGGVVGRDRRTRLESRDMIGCEWLLRCTPTSYTNVTEVTCASLANGMKQQHIGWFSSYIHIQCISW